MRSRHRRLIRRLWTTHGVSLVYVGNERAVIGYLYSFTSEAKVYYFQSGFAYQDGCKLSPGLFAHCLAIEHYRKRGLLEYDFLAGDMRYKRSLANACRTLQWATVVSPLSVALAFGIATAVGVFFGWYPARRASKLDPIVALRRD